MRCNVIFLKCKTGVSVRRVRTFSLIEFWTLNTIFACEKKMGYEKQAGKTLMMELLKNSKSERLKCELKRRGENWGDEI